jgi:hypothetical protein
MLDDDGGSSHFPSRVARRPPVSFGYCCPKEHRCHNKCTIDSQKERSQTMMMKYIYSFTLIGLTSAFHTAPALLSRQMVVPSSAALFVTTQEETITYFEDLELAVKCATKFGVCDVDTLHRLADKVEAGADSCLFEVDEALCQKEIDDRIDVAEVLRLQSELQLRMDAIAGSSLFAADVIDEQNIHQRDELFDILGEDGV